MHFKQIALNWAEDEEQCYYQKTICYCLDKRCFLFTWSRLTVKHYWFCPVSMLQAEPHNTMEWFSGSQNTIICLNFENFLFKKYSFKNKFKMFYWKKLHFETLPRKWWCKQNFHGRKFWGLVRVTWGG